VKSLGDPRTVERVVRDVVITCDFCGVQATSQFEWNAERFERDETTIESKLGSVYPEGDFRKRRWIDACPSCFESKIVPAIEALGVKFHEEDVES
jgi:hypothetical protein